MTPHHLGCALRRAADTGQPTDHLLTSLREYTPEQQQTVRQAYESAHPWRCGSAYAVNLQTDDKDLLSWDGPFVRLLAWWGDDGHGIADDPDEMRRMLTDAGRLYWFNGSSSGLVACLRHLGLDLTDRSADVDGMFIAANPPKTKTQWSLMGLAQKVLGEWELPPADLVEEFGGWEKVPTRDPRYRAHALRNAELTWRIAGTLNLGDYLAVETATTGITAHMNSRPLLVDREEARSQVVEADRRRAALAPEFEALGLPGTGNPWTTQTAREWLADRVDAEWPLTSSGLLSVSATAFQRAEEQAPDALPLARPALEALALKDSFAKQLLEYVTSEGVVWPNFRADSVNGRWSCSNPNLLGAGKRSEDLLRQRACLIASDGYLFVGADLSGADSRAMAGLSGDADYLEAVEGDLVSAVEESIGVTRTQAKALIYGLAYGKQCRSLARDLEVSEVEAVAYIKAFWGRFPTLKWWIDHQIAEAQKRRPLPNGHGRLVVANEGDEVTQAAARAAASCTKDLLVRSLMRDQGLWPFLALVVHDEVLLAVPEERADEMGERLVAAMNWEWKSPSGLVVPVRAPGWSSGKTWRDVYRDAP